MLEIVPEVAPSSAKPLFPAVPGNWLGIRNALCPLPGMLGSEPVLTAPSEVLMLTEMFSADAFGFTIATAVIKCEVLSKGRVMRLDAGPAGGGASRARFPG